MTKVVDNAAPLILNRGMGGGTMGGHSINFSSEKDEIPTMPASENLRNAPIVEGGFDEVRVPQPDNWFVAAIKRLITSEN